MTSLNESLRSVLAAGPPTIENLKKLLLQRIALTKDAEEDALWAFADELGGDLDLLEKCWDALGVDLLRAALCDKSPGVRGKKKNGKYPPARPSWRKGITKRVEVIWDLELPVGASGARKRLGDFNRDDVTQIEVFYQGQANIMTSRGAYMHRIARDMGPDDTLEKMAAEGRLQEHQMGFLGTGMQDLATFKWMAEEADEPE